jgi:predicted alpha/beta hydrolase family esterase
MEGAESMTMFNGRNPVILTVPGLNNSGPGHWQTIWEQTRGDTVRVELGMWSNPRRNPWVTRLDEAIRRAEGPVILAAHSLGAITAAWWGELAAQPWGDPVVGALLVAPPDVDDADAREEVARFGPRPRTILPFPSIVVASEDDPYCSLQRAFDMARDWGSHFVNVGCAGHINDLADLGDWGAGLRLLDTLRVVNEHPAAQAGTLAGARAMMTQ